jgi:hypothetical protein
MVNTEVKGMWPVVTCFSDALASEANYCQPFRMVFVYVGTINAGLLDLLFGEVKRWQYLLCLRAT